jgi:hypothetical protein
VPNLKNVKLTVAVASLPLQPGIMSSSACAQVVVPESSVSHHTYKHLVVDIRKNKAKTPRGKDFHR